MNYSFKPSIWKTAATIVVMAICIKLGSWQYYKAEAKLALQKQLEHGLYEAPVTLPETAHDIEHLRYKRVKFYGTYEPRYQMFLDNQVNSAVIGYHVLTPLKLMGSQQYVLVNRGWIKGDLNRQMPHVNTPEGHQEIEGDISIPLTNFFTLESPPSVNDTWQQVWQHLDIQRYEKSVPFKIKPFIVRLNAKSTAGGFDRNWPLPSERISTHLGYAFQWFGFALTLLVIYIVLNIKKTDPE